MGQFKPCGANCVSASWSGLTDRAKETAALAPDFYNAAGLLDDMSSMHLHHEIYIDCKPEAYAFAGPIAQMTEAQFLAVLQASPSDTTPLE